MFIISDNLFVFQSAFWQLNSTIFHHPESTLVWDPAYTDEEILHIYQEANKPAAANKILIYTHGDFDHIIGDHQFNNFQRIGSELMPQRLDKTDILHQIEAIDHEYYLDRNHRPGFPSLDFKISVEFPVVKKFTDLEILFYKAGGHTADGIFTVIPSLKALIAGDYLSDIEFPFIGDSIEEYYITLDTVLKLLNDYNLEIMIPGHGHPAIHADEIYKRIIQSRRYLDSLTSSSDIEDWRQSWGFSPFSSYLDKAHLKNIDYVQSKSL